MLLQLMWVWHNRVNFVNCKKWMKNLSMKRKRIVEQGHRLVLKTLIKMRRFLKEVIRELTLLHQQNCSENGHQKKIHSMIKSYHFWPKVKAILILCKISKKSVNISEFQLLRNLSVCKRDLLFSENSPFNRKQTLSNHISICPFPKQKRQCFKCQTFQHYNSHLSLQIQLKMIYC